MANALGLDPGFSNVGYAIVDIQTLIPTRLGITHTVKSDKKLKVLATDDNFRRSKEIYSAIHSLIEEYKPKIIMAEAMSFPRNASVAAKMAYAWGVLAAIAEQTKIPILQVTPQQIKKRLLGVHKGTKEEIYAAIETKYGEHTLKASGLFDLKKTDWEHPVDALSAVYTGSNSEMFNLIRQI